MEIPFEKQFHFRDGASAGNLNALKQKIESISYAEFYHHVNSEKNDFANWIRYVLKDDNLADDLQRVNSIVETVEILEDYLHPRSVVAPRTDMQSKIESSVLKQPLPLNFDDSALKGHVGTEERLRVEMPENVKTPNNPSTTPAPIDMKLIEEKLGLRKTPENISHDSMMNDPALVAQEKKVREELFGQHDHAKAQIDSSKGDSEDSSKDSVHDGSAAGAFSEPAAKQFQKSDSDPDMTRLIVKDFIYGLIFGLILGMILGRIISM